MTANTFHYWTARVEHVLSVGTTVPCHEKDGSGIRLQWGLKSPLRCSPDLLVGEICGVGPFIWRGASLLGRLAATAQLPSNDKAE